MRAQEPKLKLLRQLLGNLFRHEAAETGVHAVGVLVRAMRDRFDDIARCAHLSTCDIGELGRGAALDGDGPDILCGEIVPRQRVRRGHAPSLEARSGYSRTMSDP